MPKGEEGLNRKNDRKNESLPIPSLLRGVVSVRMRRCVHLYEYVLVHERLLVRESEGKEVGKGLSESTMIMLHVEVACWRRT